MAQICVNNLTYGYEGSFDNVFENISFSIDTNWKLGFIGRNGKGKTTFLKLLLGKYEYVGSISTNTRFDYFPYKLTGEQLDMTADELMEIWKPCVENWRVMCELPSLGISAELLYRPIRTLSFGERTKIMLAVLFSCENDFLLIDEPTNYLDREARETIKKYLASKKGFILVSHDRDLLDGCIDHVLVINRSTIEVQTGNFSSWWKNKENADNYAKIENAKHLREITKLKMAADRASRWADANENSKIGFDKRKEPDRANNARSYIGAKTKKMQSRVKSYENRIVREIEQKKGLLSDIEKDIELKITPLSHYKKRLVECKNLSIQYEGGDFVIKNMAFELNQGERIFLNGENGCGKSSLIKAILKTNSNKEFMGFFIEGEVNVASNMVISYISQDTSHLKGTLKKYAEIQNLDYSLFLALLRQLDFDRNQFVKDIENFSEGQKKKVLIAESLLTPAHLYIWDEPLNHIDVFSRIQIEKLIDVYKPTMLIVEHDVRFRENLATKIIDM